jgi:hypothetical protein
MINNFMARNYQQGYYEVQNKDKYCGTKTTIRYLSSYELHFFKWADRCPSVLSWSAENTIVPYFNPIKNRQARYIVDIYLKYKDKNGNIREELVEIKPEQQAKKPQKGRKSQKTYETEMMTWIVNESKWKAAQQYAKERGWGFRVITENSIFRG